MNTNARSRLLEASATKAVVTADAHVVKNSRSVGLLQDVAGTQGSVSFTQGHKPGSVMLSVRVGSESTYLELGPQATTAVSDFFKNL